MSKKKAVAPVEEEVVPQALGPGDGDGKHRGVAGVAAKPLGPGDDDGKDRGQAAEVRGPLAPGESDPNDRENRNIRMLAQPAPGPGENYTARRITVFEHKEN